MLEIEYSNILISINNLAMVFRNQEKYKKAKKINRRALKEREKILEIEYLNTLININNLAVILRDQEKYEKAEKL
jgi:hypothetical protein